jgi:hypothetical protein
LKSAEGAKVDGLRCFVACSYAYASSMSVGSLRALPEKEIPHRQATEVAAGTVTCGYPATEVTVDGPGATAVPPSPLTR